MKNKDKTSKPLSSLRTILELKEQSERDFKFSGNSKKRKVSVKIY